MKPPTPTHYDLVWRQQLAGGTEVLQRAIPVDQALAVLNEYRGQALRGELGAGAVVYLQVAGEHDRQARIIAYLGAAATDADAELGRIAYDVWRAEQVDRLVPWEQLPADEQEGYTRIGRTLFVLGCAATLDKE
jgi:hypothetical protein